MRSLRRAGFSMLLMVAALGNAIHSFAAENLEALANERFAAISASSAESIPREKIESLWKGIQEDWYNTNLPLRIGKPKVEPSSLLQARLTGIIQNLIARDAIKTLSPEIKKKLELDGLNCRFEGHCTSIDGLYLPLNHLIFLDSTLSQKELQHVLLHELIHAYQFTYRLPIDIATLADLVAKEKLKQEEVGLYLDYYYESQANWKALQFDFPDQWYFSISKSQKLQIGLSRLLLSGGVAYAAIGTSAGTGFAIYGAGWLLGVAYGNAMANRLLPEVAKSESWFTLGNTPGNEVVAATTLPELVPIDDTFTRISSFAAYNFDFHRDYGAAIQKYYFGNERFLFRNDRNDLAIYNQLHDRYYERIGLSTALENESACVALLSKIRSANVVPLVTWLTLPREEIETCSVYRNEGKDDGRSQYLDGLLYPQNQSDPFHTGFPGTEGSRPGLTILPQLRVLPIK